MSLNKNLDGGYAWDDETKRITCQHATYNLRDGPAEVALMLPGSRALCVASGIRAGTLDPASTFLIAVERKRALQDAVRESARKLGFSGERGNFHLFGNSLDCVDLSHLEPVLGRGFVIDYSFLDICGDFTPGIFEWLRVYRKFFSGPTTRLAMTSRADTYRKPMMLAASFEAVGDDQDRFPEGLMRRLERARGSNWTRRGRKDLEGCELGVVERKVCDTIRVNLCLMQYALSTMRLEDCRSSVYAREGGVNVYGQHTTRMAFIDALFLPGKKKSLTAEFDVRYRGMLDAIQRVGSMERALEICLEEYGEHDGTTFDVQDLELEPLRA